MLRKIIILLLFISASPIILAAPEFRTYNFLRQFDLAAASTCQARLQACYPKEKLLEANCVRKLVAQAPECQKFSQLAQIIELPMSAIHCKKFGNLILIQANFPADGHTRYYLLARDGCLINTEIDPRQVDLKLQKKYPHQNFFILNDRKPSFKRLADGRQIFQVSLRITDTCRACKVLGLAELRFIFDPQGQLQKIYLQKFTPNLN